MATIFIIFKLHDIYDNCVSHSCKVANVPSYILKLAGFSLY